MGLIALTLSSLKSFRFLSHRERTFNMEGRAWMHVLEETALQAVIVAAMYYFTNVLEHVKYPKEGYYPELFLVG